MYGLEVYVAKVALCRYTCKFSSTVLVRRLHFEYGDCTVCFVFI